MNLSDIFKRAAARFRFSGSRGGLSVDQASRKFKRERAEYYLHMANLMTAMPDRPTTEFFRKDIERYKNEPRGVLSAYWLSRAEGTNGESQVAFLSEIYAGTVPQEDIAVLAIAERAGDAKQGMHALARTIAAAREVRQSIIAILGSVIITGIIIQAELFVFAFVQMPEVTDAMSGLLTVAEYGPMAKKAYYTAGFIRAVGWLFVIAEITIIAWTVKAVPVYVGGFRAWLDKHYLPFQFYRMFSSIQFLGGLSAITRRVSNDQRNLREGLEILSENSPTWLRSHVDRMRVNLDFMPVQRGEVFNTGLFDRKAMHWIEDLSDHEPDLSKRLEKVEVLVLEEAPRKLKRTSLIVYAVATISMVAFILSTYFISIAINSELKTAVKIHQAYGR